MLDASFVGSPSAPYVHAALPGDEARRTRWSSRPQIHDTVFLSSRHRSTAAGDNRSQFPATTKARERRTVVSISKAFPSLFHWPTTLDTGR